MIKRRTLTIATLTVLILLGLVFLFTYKYFSQGQYSNWLVNGTVKELKNKSIVVEGLVRSSDSQNNLDEKKTIEFIITSQTILKKSIISATIEQMKSGKPFHPETIITAGVISDLIEGVGLFKIESKDNLFSVDNATALEIDYIIYDFPLPTR